MAGSALRLHWTFFICLAAYVGLDGFGRKFARAAKRGSAAALQATHRCSGRRDRMQQSAAVSRSRADRSDAAEAEEQCRVCLDPVSVSQPEVIKLGCRYRPAAQRQGICLVV